MTTQYTPILKLALPVTGELSGTWGDTVNDNITSMIEQAVAGLATISTWTSNSHTLTTANGTTSESRCAMLVAQDGAGLTAAGEIVCPASSKLYVLKNDSSYAITLKTSAGSGVAVASGNTAFLFCDGTNVNACVTTIVDGRVTGNLTVDGNATINGNTTLGNATTDTITATARFASGLTPSADNTYDLGSSANSWKDVYIDGTAYLALVDINGGTIDGVSIGASTAATIINVDNLRLDGNTLSSTDTNGNVVIAPNGTGDVQLDADTVRVGDSGAAATLTSNGAGALTVTTGGAANLVLSTNSGTTSGTITIANGANGNIAIVPDGTGDVQLDADTVRIGDANTDVTLTTNGTGNLNLTTNGGTNSGTIQIAQGANGNITLTPNGTGLVSIPSAVISGGTANGVAYLNGSKVLTTGSALTFDGSNMGLGVTPSAWGSTFRGFEVGRVGSGIAVNTAGTFNAVMNCYIVDGPTVYYANNGFATRYVQISADGAHAWYIAPSGTAGNPVTFTQAMTLNASGNLGIGTTSPTSTLSVTGSANVTGNVTLGDATTDTVTVNGYMGVGALNSAFGFNVASSALTGTTNVGVNSQITGTASATTEVSAFRARPGTAASAYTVSNTFGLYVFDATKGAGSTITTQYGVYVADLTQGNSNYGIVSAVSSGTNKWNIYASGTASNYMAGQLQLGDGSAATPALSNFGDENTGIFFPAADTIAFAEGGTEAMRIDSSGNLIRGATAGVTSSGGAICGIETLSGTTAGSSIGQYAFATTNTAPFLEMGFSRNATVGSQTVVNSGDVVGAVRFSASDGTNFVRAAQIIGVVDGTPGTNDMPGRLVFSTSADGSATPTERMRIDSAGNLGLGATPSAWATVVPAIQIGATGAFLAAQSGSTNVRVGVNAYYNANWIYTTTGAASMHQQAAGVHSWHNAPSGTAGTAITFTQAMTLDSSGQLGIGTTSPLGVLDVAGTAPTLNIRDTQSKVAWAAGETVGTLDFYSNDTSGVGAQAVSRIRSVADTASAATSGALAFWTAAAGAAATEKVRITSAGNVGIGTSSPSGLLDASSGVYAIIMGADSGVTTRTNATQKLGRFGGYHYTNAEEPVCLILSSAEATNNIVSVGGGTSNMNTATQLRFFTAANSTTLTGTERMRIDSAGNVQTLTGAQVVWAPAPASISTTATLTNANIQGQIINTTGTSYTVTMPLGTTLETLVAWATTDLGYDFTVINTASGTITMAVNTGVTSLGGLTIATGVSAQFRIRRTAANTFILYRLS